MPLKQGVCDLMQDLFMDFNSDQYPAGTLKTITDNYGNYTAIPINNYSCHPGRGFYGFANTQSGITVSPFFDQLLTRKITQIHLHPGIWGIAVIETVKELHPYEMICSSNSQNSEFVFSNPIGFHMQEVGWRKIGKYVLAFQSRLTVDNLLYQPFELYDNSGLVVSTSGSKPNIPYYYVPSKLNYPNRIIWGANSASANAVFSGYIRRCGFYPYSMVQTFCKRYL